MTTTPTRQYPADYCLLTHGANGACILWPDHESPCCDANGRRFQGAPRTPSPTRVGPNPFIRRLFSGDSQVSYVGVDLDVVADGTREWTPVRQQALALAKHRRQAQERFDASPVWRRGL